MNNGLIIFIIVVHLRVFVNNYQIRPLESQLGISVIKRILRIPI